MIYHKLSSTSGQWLTDVLNFAARALTFALTSCVVSLALFLGGYVYLRPEHTLSRPEVSMGRISRSITEDDLVRGWICCNCGWKNHPAFSLWEDEACQQYRCDSCQSFGDGLA